MKTSKTKLQIILSHTCTYFNLLNLFLAALVIVSGQYRQMLFLGVVVSNSLIGIIQELKVKRLIDRLSVITATKVKIVTNAGIREIAVEDLQPGNILRMASGDQIAADSTVLSSDGLEVNESLLTGESVPVLKKPGDMLFSGSFIVAGSGTCEVIHIGEDNYATKLVAKAKTKKRASSEMQNAIKKIIRYVSYAIIPIGLLLFYMQYYRVGNNLSNSLVNTVAGVLGMIPEGLVLLTSVSFILGVGRLARKNALVQEMEAIEALARVNVLCLDKTGTITTGELSVEEVLPVSTDKNDTLPLNTVLDLLAHVLYAFEDDNATGTALKQYLSSRTSYTQSGIQQDISASVPFSSRRKFMGVTLNQSDSYVLGAPDFLTKNPKVCKQAEKLSAQGLRVLLLASCKELADSPKTLREVTPVAIITLTDCIKENAPDMFHFFETQGVQVKIISGDNPATVSAVGVRAGIPGASNYVDAASLEGKSQEELTEVISRYTVFGRVSPEMKQRIVKAFQNTSSDSHKKGRNVVGMVGDGVNDVLALKDADCAIAMANGADAARHAAHIVLMDSDFSSMKEIVREGRTIIANIERVSALYLTKTLYSILLCVLFIILGKSYPFTPIQLTLIGATAIGIPSFLLALEHHEEVTTCGFLKYVLRISLPAALLLTAILAAIQFIAPVFSLSASAVRFLNLLLGGIVSLGVVVRVCMPMNRRRFALCIGVTTLFFGALLLMPEVFGLR